MLPLLEVDGGEVHAGIVAGVFAGEGLDGVGSEVGFLGGDAEGLADLL